jgi:hypothetical protein
LSFAGRGTRASVRLGSACNFCSLQEVRPFRAVLAVQSPNGRGLR